MNYRLEGQTQRDNANLANISRDVVIRIESGKNVSLGSFKAYLDACGKELVIIDKRC